MTIPTPKPYTEAQYLKRRRQVDKMYSEYRKALVELESRCPHDWQYVPDPSGNNDSSHRCRLCWKESRK